MRGSIRKRGSTYSYWLDIGPDPVTGKRRQRTKGGFRTKRECQAALNEAISALRSGTLVQPSRRTVASFLVEEWLPAVRMAGLRDSTWASYRMNVEKHLVPGLGAIELQRLSPAQLNAFYRELLTRAAATPLAAWRRRRCATSTRSCIGRCAMRCAGALWSATWLTRLTRRRPKTPEMQVWSPEQLRAFLDHVRADRLYAAWLLAATTGMRRGEILGLRWSDLDLEAGRVAVRRPRIVVDYQVQVSEPKTAKGRRSLALDPATVAALRAHRARQAEEKLAVGGRLAGLRAGVHPARMGPPSIRSGSQTGSGSMSGRLGCRGSGCMMFATATRARRWPPGSRPRW